jgi:hypothetical protein
MQRNGLGRVSSTFGSITPYAVLLILAACSGGGGGRPPPSFSIGGTVSGLSGSGLVLQLNGGSALMILGNGAFTFPTQIARGSNFTVSASVQPLNPSQTCSIANGSGRIMAAISNVAVTCTTNSFKVGVTVSGLAGSGLVLINNGADNLTRNGNGAAQFMTAVLSGASYDVRVLTQPVDDAAGRPASDMHGVQRYWHHQQRRRRGYRGNMRDTRCTLCCQPRLHGCVVLDLRRRFRQRTIASARVRSHRP